MSSGVYFYNRTDYGEILKTLSPIRPKIERFIIKLQYFGLITNLLCAFILVQKQIVHRKSILYLLFLSISDFLYNLLSLLPDFLRALQLVDYDIFKQSNLSCFFYDLRITTFHFYSVVLTLFVTLDRFNHIHKPLKFNRSLNNLKTKLLMGLLMFLISFIIALPHGFLMVYNEAEKDCDGREFFKKKLFNTNTSLTYYQVYFSLTEPVIIWFLPGILILVMNSYVIYKIFKSNQISSKKFGASNLFNAVVVASSKKIKNKKNNENEISPQKNSIDEKKNNFLKTPNSFDMELKLDCSNKVCFSNESKNLRKQSEPLMNTKMVKQFKGSMSLDENLQNQSSNKLEFLPFVALFLRKKSNNLVLTNTMNSAHKSNSFNNKNSKISVNQISHYVTIIALGFYFILSTIPYGIFLSYQNNLTLRLDYNLREKEDYLSDATWLKFGKYREFTVVAKLFFASNHVLNFFFYLVFNRLFRFLLVNLMCTFLLPIKCLVHKMKLKACFNCFNKCTNKSRSEIGVASQV